MKSSSQNRTARSVAAEAMTRFDPHRTYAASVLEALLPATDEKQRTTDLVYGTIRNTAAIDCVISSVSGRDIKRIQNKLLGILRVAIYELIYCPQTAVYSVVDQAVETTKTVAGRKQSGFVNAVLRQSVRSISQRSAPLPQSNSRSTIPQTPSSGCTFDTEILPDPQADPGAYLSTAFSLPQWLAEQWLEQFGFDEAIAACFGVNRRPSIYLRPNRLKTTAERLAAMLTEASVEAHITPDESLVQLKSPRAVTTLPGFDDGLFVIQDISAYRAVELLKPQPDWNILDLCSAPGVKATQIAEATADRAQILAADIDTERLRKVTENAARLGITSISTVDRNRLQAAVGTHGPFDAVLLDVPCSNTGVMARRVEVRHRISATAIEKLARTQRQLLEKAALLTKPGGKICYSTCSIQNAEDGRLIAAFLAENSDFALEKEQLILPAAQQFDHDGAYAAVIRKV